MERHLPCIHPDEHATPPASDARSPVDLLESVHHLVGSSEPAVVFGSLARLCAGAFCDSVVVDTCEGEDTRYRVAYPRERGQSAPVTGPGQHVHGVSFSAGNPSFAGTAWFSWIDYMPSRSDETVAALLIDRAVALIETQRLEDELNGARELAGDLRASLVSNRRIGVAIGILMRTHAITEDVAFDRLRVASQNNRQQLRDITEEIVRVGYLDRCLVPTRRLWPRDVP